MVSLLDRIPHLGPLLRTWHGRVIVLVVVSQLLLPLHYYLVRRDRHDERFSWRMFSPMRMTRCEPQLTIDDKRVELLSEFHPAWTTLAERGRLTVLEAMGAHLCAKYPGKSVRFLVSCQYIDRDPIVFGGFNLCEAPQI